MTVIPRNAHLTCRSGHLMCVAVEDVRVGDSEWGAKFGGWERFGQRQPAIGSDVNVPCWCGSRIQWPTIGPHGAR